MKLTENPTFEENRESEGDLEMEILPSNHRFPFCVVWTPIPFITWLFPFIGHMGIGTSRGVIRDFSCSYHVSEDDMGFGWPTRYLQLKPNKVAGGADAWDLAVRDASDEYKTHAHNLFCDNCHSHVALALNTMKYDQRTNFNMFYLATVILFKGRYVGFGGFLKQWLPFVIIVIFIVSIFVVSSI